ncbi:hypothetical protein [Labilibaculum sp.]|uniref:hypothetical protein n=1 Tax=Labilibaculum sp. TaxID=2060723 RepID=UPI002AA60745|nr:hypothetical protein [Labilibaculum sp.]MBN2595263.1 hypothetical protein [Marinifilaceae bacterium]
MFEARLNNPASKPMPQHPVCTPVAPCVSPSQTIIEQSALMPAPKTTELLPDSITNKTGNHQESIVLPVKPIGRESGKRLKTVFMPLI